LYWPVLIILATGVRRGEALACGWRWINLDTGTAIVAESLEQTKKGLRFKSTKSDKAPSITMPAFAVAELRRFKAEQARELLAIGVPKRTGHWCAGEPTHSTGTEQSTLMRHSRPDRARTSCQIKIKGAPRVSLHKLRHSHASMLIAAEENLKTIQERAGHSSIAVTIDIYGHLTEGAQATAAARLDKVVGR
jgi:integrase